MWCLLNSVYYPLCPVEFALTTLPVSCYLTSTIIYGYQEVHSSSDAFIFPNQTIRLPQLSSITPSPPSTPPPTLSTVPGFGSLTTNLGSGAEQPAKSSDLNGVPIGTSSLSPSLTSSTPISNTPAALGPASPSLTTAITSGLTSSANRFYISVAVSTALPRLAKRNIYYVAFSGD